jgi:multidrug efflux pump subunit AcrA (membrane-fusion protein)
MRRLQAVISVALFLSVATVAHADDNDGLALRGVVKAVNEAAISSEVPGAILELPFREGASFKQGDRLIAFDCAALQAMRLKRSARASWPHGKMSRAFTSFAPRVRMKSHWRLQGTKKPQRR